MVEPRPEYLDLVRAGDRSALDRLGEAPELAGARDAAGVPAVLVALYHGHRDLAAALFATGAQADAAVLAALGEAEALRGALETDPEARDRRTPDGFQPLHLAAFFAREAALSLLLDRGADVDAIADQPARMRPIHAAAASRSAGPVMALLNAGADPNAVQRGGFTALMSAAAHGLKPMVDALLRAGGDPALAAEDGRTPADFARAGGHDVLAARLSQG